MTNWGYSREVFVTRQKSRLFTAVRLTGIAAILFGAFRLFGIGVYGMNGIGPLSRGFFTTPYLPGPWTAFDTTWTLAFIWMGIGIAIVGFTTR